MNNLRKDKKGYALVSSIVIIGTVLLMMATVSARRVQDGFFSSIKMENHVKAHYLAEGCMDVAFLRIAQNSSYVGNEVVTIAGQDCTIRSIVGNVVEVEAESNDHWYRLRVVLTSLDPVEVATWERVASF